MGCRSSSPTTTPPGSLPGTATAPQTRSEPSNAALLSAYLPTYPWPPEQRSQLSQQPGALQCIGAAYQWNLAYCASSGASTGFGDFLIAFLVQPSVGSNGFGHGRRAKSRRLHVSTEPPMSKKHKSGKKGA